MRLIMAFVPRFLNPGREHFFLLGPRGTGKTSWCAHQFPNALRIDLLDPATLRPLSAQPERLAEMVAAALDRKSTRLNSSHDQISYAVFCLKKKKKTLNIELDSITSPETNSASPVI